jgi:hypothetical protein
MCCAVVALSCSASGNRQPSTASEQTITSQPSSASYGPEIRAFYPSRAEQLAVDAVMCFSDVWPEPRGAVSAARVELPERRCAELVDQLYGSDSSVAAARVDRIRALDAAEILALEERLDQEAQRDASRPGDAPVIAAFIDAAAAAYRETRAARNATPGLRTARAVPPNPVRDARSLALLFQGSYGELTPSAHALALMFAIQRVQAATALAPTLEVYALEQPLAAVLNVPLPPPEQRVTGSDEAALDYLTRAAAASGHPVLIAVRTPAEREVLATTGLLDALGDQLRSAAQRMPAEGDMTRVADTVAQRADLDLRTAQADIVQRRDTPPSNVMGTPR